MVLVKVLGKDGATFNKWEEFAYSEYCEWHRQVAKFPLLLLQLCWTDEKQKSHEFHQKHFKIFMGGAACNWYIEEFDFDGTTIGL